MYVYVCPLCGDERQHKLSECRPDLVEHEPGPDCTWHGLSGYEPPNDCYAYDEEGNHILFHEDTNMVTKRLKS